MDGDLIESLAREVVECLSEVEAKKARLLKFCEDNRHELEKRDFKVDAYSSLLLEIDFFVKQELAQTVQACRKLISVLERAEKRTRKTAHKSQQNPSKT